MRFAALLLCALAFGAAAAPDEELLGKAQGYPVCPLGPTEQRCLVGQYSHFDEIVPARRVAKGDSVHELKRAPKEPADLNADAYMAAWRNTGLLVVKGDTIYAERYQYERKPADRFTSMSMAKTVVAMLIGIAIAEGKIGSIDQVAQEYVPALRGQPYGETRLRHLLTMSSGVKFSEEYNGSDDVSRLVRKTFFQQGPGGADTVAEFTERARPAGEKFSYASAETEVLGLVLRAAVGMPLADYLSQKIWQPMGAEADASWLVDRGGYEIAYCCINATLRDWARLGMLLATGGALDGRQIIPADWVSAATTAESPHLQIGAAAPQIGYGYQTWLVDTRGRFALLGVRGQAVFVDPLSKLVVVHTAVYASPLDAQARASQFRFFYSTLRNLSSL